MKRILVLTGDRIGDRMAGPAIRAWEMSRFLSRRHQVVLSCPEISGGIPELPDHLLLTPFGTEPRWSDLHNFDAVIMPASMHCDAHFDTPVLVDLYDPFILSSLSRTDKTEAKQSEELQSLMRNLQRGDLFVCASDRQRDFWIGMLAGAGRVNVRQFQADPHLRALIKPAPFGIDAAGPEPGEACFPGDPTSAWIVWAGGIWDWFDPMTAVHAIHKLNQTGRKVSLFFMGTNHPNPGMTRMKMVEQTHDLVRQLGLLNKSVFFGDWIPYDRRGSFLSAAKIGISTHFPHLETHFSYRTRILDFIWSRLPFICTEGDYFADMASSKNVGIAVPPEDPEAVVRAVTKMLDEPVFYQACKHNIDTVASTMTWERVLDPVMEFCSNPGRAPDTNRPPVQSGESGDLYMTGCETAVIPAGEILKKGLTQTVTLPLGGVHRIDLKLATYNRLNTGFGVFELIDPHGSTIVQIPFDLASVHDNQWLPFRFGPLSTRPGSTWRIRLTCPFSAPGNAVTIWADDTVREASYEINGLRNPGSINYRIFYRNYPGSDHDTPHRNRSNLRIPWISKR